MNYVRSIFLLVLFNYSMYINSIEHIHSFSQAQSVLDDADTGTLVVFDVDDTLIRPKDKILQRCYSYINAWKLVDAEFRKMVNEEEHTLSRLYIQAKRELIEPGISQLIATLQARNIKVIACTHLRVGPYGEIPLLEEFRFNQLKELDIDFTMSFDYTCIFNQCQQDFNNWPLFYKGILFTNLCTKGEVLGAFIDLLDVKPRKIIFFDDQLPNLVSVQNELLKRAITFYGYCYKTVPGLESKFNAAVATYQINYFNTYQIWLSDTKAEELLR